MHVPSDNGVAVPAEQRLKRRLACVRYEAGRDVARTWSVSDARWPPWLHLWAQSRRALLSMVVRQHGCAEGLVPQPLGPRETQSHRKRRLFWPILVILFLSNLWPKHGLHFSLTKLAQSPRRLVWLVVFGHLEHCRAVIPQEADSQLSFWLVCAKEQLQWKLTGDAHCAWSFLLPAGCAHARPSSITFPAVGATEEATEAKVRGAGHIPGEWDERRNVEGISEHFWTNLKKHVPVSTIIFSWICPFGKWFANFSHVNWALFHPPRISWLNVPAWLIKQGWKISGLTLGENGLVEKVWALASALGVTWPQIHLL